MANILYRASSTPTVPGSTTVKGAGLSNLEIDGNWKSLNDAKLEVSDAVSTNTANKVVLRDASGNFAAGTITAALNGNASTAATLQTARTINGTSFDGSANITITASTTNTLTIGSYLTGTSFNGSTAVTIAANASTTGTSNLVARDASGNFSAGTITAALSGNASTATTLQTARTINGTSFDGSANITITASTTNTLTRGTYLTGSNFNGASATTWAVDADSTNQVSKVVARDANGDFAGRVISGVDFNTTSDRNFKENIQSISNPIGILEQIEGVSFDWKADGRASFGVIAQELQAVLPQLIGETNEGLTVSYIPIIAILIEAVKQQQKQIEELQSRVL